MAQQIYAKIKKNSKYFDQNKYHQERKDLPFPVEIVGDDHWCVKGGIGGQYRLSDVNLFVKHAGTEIRIR